MHSKSTTRRSQATPAGRVLAVVLALWINLAVQPCAMAISADSGCPHCPPAAEDTMAMAHDHHDADADTDCATFGADCGEIDDFGIDSRGSQSKIKDKAEIVALVPVLSGVPSRLRAATPATATDPPEIAVAPPPLHLLNCVFLD